MAEAVLRLLVEVMTEVTVVTRCGGTKQSQQRQISGLGSMFQAIQQGYIAFSQNKTKKVRVVGMMW